MPAGVSDIKCVGGCGRPVARKDARCPDCRKAIRAAQARARRRQPVVPPMPAPTATEVTDALAAATSATNSLLLARRGAEQRGLDALPLKEVDLWLLDIQAALITANRAGEPWVNRARDIRQHVREP